MKEQMDKLKEKITPYIAETPTAMDVKLFKEYCSVDYDLSIYYNSLGKKEKSNSNFFDNKWIFPI